MDHSNLPSESSWDREARLTREWLAGLKVGDRVCYTSSGIWGSTTIDTVESITPTRIFKLKSGLTFNSRGRVRGDHRVGYLFPYTQKVQDELRHKALVSKLSRVNWEKRNLLELEDVVATLRLE